MGRLEWNNADEQMCKNCIQKEYEEIHIEKCPKCGRESMMAELDGACMVLSCSNCDFKVIGASFLPPCVEDNCDYTISVANIEKEKKIKVAKLFGINVFELLKIHSEEKKVQITTKLYEAKAILEGLNELDIESEVQPPLIQKFPELLQCKFWIPN